MGDHNEEEYIEWLRKKSSRDLAESLNMINQLFEDGTDATYSTWAEWTKSYTQIEEILIERGDEDYIT